MKAIVYKSPGKWEFEDRPKPKLTDPKNVLLRVLGVGICGTDLHVLQIPQMHPAKPDIILGHEYAAVVEEVGAEVDWLNPGDHVVVDPHPPCGTCMHCRSDRPEMCTSFYCQQGTPYEEHGLTRGLFQDGALTSYTCVPAQSVYKISKDVPYNIAALAEPLACTGFAIEKLKIQAGDTVCVLGAGPIGLLFTTLAKTNGASKVIVSEPHEYRRNKSLKCGADIVVNPDVEDIRQVCLKETGIGVDHCIEAVGQLLMTAIDCIRPNGKVLMFGHDETATPGIRLAEIVRKEAQIYGGFLGKYYFEKTVRIIESGILKLEEIASHTFPLSRFQDALDTLRKGEAIKAVVYPEEY
ncbi:MAG: zinc-dependent alcohol dehydrogenase [Acetivibrionales bacterium]|jgi:threonine dehydrogenase-like Zn-dependent dehydrogenase